MKKEIRDLHVTIQVSNMIQIQLLLQKWLLQTIKPMKLLKLKDIRVELKKTYDLILTKTSQSHADTEQMPNNQLNNKL